MTSRVWIRTPIALFLAACVAIGAVVVAAMTMREAVRHSDEVVTEKAMSLGQVERLRAQRERVSRKVRSYLLLRDERFLTEVGEAERAFEQLLLELQGDAGSPRQRQLMEHLAERERARRQVTKQLIAAESETTAVAHILESDLQPILDAMDAAIRECTSRKRAEKRQCAAQQRRQRGRTSESQSAWRAQPAAWGLAAKRAAVQSTSGSSRGVPGVTIEM